MTVYLDLFVLKNLAFNILIIFLCGKILKQKMNIKRYLLSALFGSSYAVVVILTKNIFLMSNVTKLFVAAIMVFIAYPINNVKTIFSSYSIFIFATSCIGGLLISMNIERVFIKQLFGFCSSTTLLYVFWKIYKKTLMCEKYKCKVKIIIDDIAMDIDAYIDTGNTLKDVVSGESVIFVSQEVLERKLPENLIKILKAEVFEFEEKYYGKIKMIEYQTVSSKSNILIGIKADSVIVENNDCIIKNENIIVAPAENKFNNCEALIGLNILEEGYVYGNSTSFKNESKKIME